MEEGINDKRGRYLALIKDAVEGYKLECSSCSTTYSNFDDLSYNGEELLDFYKVLPEPEYWRVEMFQSLVLGITFQSVYYSKELNKMMVEHCKNCIGNYLTYTPWVEIFDLPTTDYENTHRFNPKTDTYIALDWVHEDPIYESKFGPAVKKLEQI